MSLRFLKDSEIEAKIEEFLDDYELKDNLPVDVEHILEFYLGVNLNIIPNLEKTHAIECYLSADFSMVTIDESSFKRNPRRARFSIAHEIAHIILHKQYYESLSFKDPDEYIEKMSAIPDEDHKRIERQAYIFAGYLLLPTKFLKAEIESFTKNFGGTEKMTVTDLQNFIEGLVEKFDVSKDVIRIQLETIDKAWLQRVIGSIDS